MNVVNLHLHSTASDGLLTGKQLINKAIEQGLKIISITDHDSVDEIESVINYAKDKDITIIPGVELTAECLLGQCHVLGYNMALEPIKDFSHDIKISRQNKAKKMIESLIKDHYHITYEEVLNRCNNEIIGRRDIALVLTEKGYYSDEESAIKDLFVYGKKYYIKTKRNKIEDCIKIIKQSGGYAVLAHPWTLNISMEDMKKFLQKYHFEGIEVYNHNISFKQYNQLLSLADELKILKTCGTDFHGHKGLNDLIVDQDVDCDEFLKKVKVKH